MFYGFVSYSLLAFASIQQQPINIAMIGEIAASAKPTSVLEMMFENQRGEPSLNMTKIKLDSKKIF